MTGISPFGSEANTEEDVYRDILYGKISAKMPYGVRGKSKDFLLALIVRNPHRRLGCHPRPESDIKEHPYFSDLDWEAVESLNVDPEFTDKPVTEDKEDKNRDETDFEKYYEEMF